MGFVAGFQIAVFAFVGIELVGTTAAETKDPEKNLPRAINSIPIRVLLFYVGALIVLMSVTPWTAVPAPATARSSRMFSLAGLGVAAGVVNFVVLTSAMSSANSGIYSTSRMVYGLAQEGDAPQRLRQPVPAARSRRTPCSSPASSCSPAWCCCTPAGHRQRPSTWSPPCPRVCFVFVWSIILASYVVFRRRRPHLHDASKFKMPGGIPMVWVVFAFFAFVLWALTTQPDTLTALLVTPVWFILLGAAWFVLRRRPAHLARYASFQAELAQDEESAVARKFEKVQK